MVFDEVSKDLNQDHKWEMDSNFVTDQKWEMTKSMEYYKTTVNKLIFVYTSQ